MKKKRRALASLCALALGLSLLGGCAAPGEEADTTHILATTYPVYLFTTALTEGVEGVEVDLLVKEQVSCLHDYTLTVADMKAIEGADVLVLNGVGLEAFMSAALEQSSAAVIDASAGLELLSSPEYAGHDHDHDGHGDHGHEQAYDPHIWMDPHLAGQMVDNIAAGLAGIDAHHADAYGENRQAALDALSAIDPYYRDALYPPYSLITFHDGFQYFAQAYGFQLLKAIEEEEGSTVSAREIVEVVELVREQAIPAIFTEKNGSTATAQAISRETGCRLYSLDMLMSGEGSGIQPYLDAMQANLNTIREALSCG